MNHKSLFLLVKTSRNYKLYIFGEITMFSYEKTFHYGTITCSKLPEFVSSILYLLHCFLRIHKFEQY